MVRRVFFSFHYEMDVWRAGQVRNSWVTKPDRETAGFFDSAEWEHVKKKGDDAIEKWIDKQLEGTSVTVVLIGNQTYGRKWINYEITSSWKRGNELLGICIHNLKDKNQQTDTQGRNPFEQWTFRRNGNIVQIPIYDWLLHDGYNNLGKWVEIVAPK
ncbi:MAG: TIR domain-containing protein [Candidatus Aenigmarchaeota archaeon]|nr:TIR domain-containing protein [Candidatus Aenigmarchaeota archaeon]